MATARRAGERIYKEVEQHVTSEVRESLRIVLHLIDVHEAHLAEPFCQTLDRVARE